MVGKCSRCKELYWYGGMLLFAFAFLSIFSIFTSPFTVQVGRDAAFFRVVGQGMTEGLLPYRDFFDMKGPYMFLIQYISQLICFGRIGCFIYQLLNLTVIFLILDRIHLSAAPKLGYAKRFLMLLPYSWVMAVTFEGGNLTEEFSLPFLLICIYCSVKYFTNPNPEKHPILYAFIYGAAFGVIALIRITNAATICALVAYILFTLILKKQYINILHNALAFLLGLVLAVIPAVIYCLCSGIFTEMIDAVFLFGFSYANEGGLINWFFLDINNLIFVPLVLLPIIVAFISSRKNRYIKWMILINAIFLTVILSMGNCYPHYFTLVIPHLALGFVLLLQDTEGEGEKRKASFKHAGVVVLCLISLSWMFILGCNNFIRSAIFEQRVNSAAVEIAEKIPKEDQGSVYTYGIGSSWYAETGLYPCIKYCDWQAHYIKLKPQIENELVTEFAENPPKWVVTEKTAQPKFLQKVLNEQYVLFSQNDSYKLWTLKNKR